MTLFLGPKERKLLKSGVYGKLKFDESIKSQTCCQWMVFAPLSEGLLWLMGTIYRVIPNYGVAIMVLVALVRLGLHHFNRTSQVSMMRMSKLGPEIEKLKKKYGNNREELSRAQMAVFIVRLTHGPFFQPPPAIGIFDDVVVEDYGVFADYIEQLFNDGITSGCAPGMYCPDDPILRSEMAVFITKAKGWMPIDPPTGIFADVPTDHWAAGFIERIATEGVTSGCGDGTNYCPGGNVSRAEMAVFLVNGWNIETFVHPMP